MLLILRTSGGVEVEERRIAAHMAGNALRRVRKKHARIAAGGKYHE